MVILQTYLLYNIICKVAADHEKCINNPNSPQYGLSCAAKQYNTAIMSNVTQEHALPKKMHGLWLNVHFKVTWQSRMLLNN